MRQGEALEFDIEIVFDGQREGILKPEVEVAGAHQLMHTGRVFEPHIWGAARYAALSKNQMGGERRSPKADR